MKKLIFLVFLLLLNACDDGDLQIERVDFDAVDVASCGNLDIPTETTFFFKIDQDEALLLNLAEGLLVNETSTAGTLKSTLPSNSNLIYRLFSDNVTQDYFCNAIPPLEPTVLVEEIAEEGDIAVDTKVDNVTKDNKSYMHTVSITGLTLQNDLGERITDSTTMEYGDFNSTTPNSAKLEVPFSNYEAIANYSGCLEEPSAGSIRFYKSINDEFISLDIPVASLANVATPEGEPRKIALTDGVFKYVVLNALVSSEAISDFPCATTPFPETIESWNFHSTAGNLSIETVENEPDGEGLITYTHTFTLENLILTLKGNGDDVNDVPLAAIVSTPMGSIITLPN